MIGFINNEHNKLINNIYTPNTSEHKTIRQKIEKVGEFLEKKVTPKFTESLLGSNIKRIQSLTGFLRGVYTIVDQVDRLIRPEIFKSIAEGNEDPRPYKVISAPLRVFKILNVINVFENLVNLLVSLKGLIKDKGIKKLDDLLQMIKSSTSIVGNIESILDAISAVNSALKLADLAEKVFAGFSLLGSTIGSIITIRSWKKTNEFYDNFKGKISKTENKYTPGQYNKILEFIKESTTIKQLSINDPKKFQKAIDKKFKLDVNQSEITQDQQKDIDNLINTLKGRVKVIKVNYVVNMIGNAFGIVSSALSIASIVCWPLILISASFSVITTAGLYIHKQITDYKFENKIGMIERSSLDSNERDSVLWKIKDFARWYFKIPVSKESKQTIHLNNPIYVPI